MRKVLANTTPLIALANIDRLELLHKLYGTIIVPQAVMDEIIREPAKQRVHNAPWIKVETIQDQSQKDLFRARLHNGEVEVMILARELKADLEARTGLKIIKIDVGGVDFLKDSAVLRVTYEGGKTSAVDGMFEVKKSQWREM